MWGGITLPLPPQPEVLPLMGCVELMNNVTCPAAVPEEEVSESLLIAKWRGGRPGKCREYKVHQGFCGDSISLACGILHVVVGRLFQTGRLAGGRSSLISTTDTSKYFTSLGNLWLVLGYRPLRGRGRTLDTLVGRSFYGKIVCLHY